MVRSVKVKGERECFDTYPKVLANICKLGDTSHDEYPMERGKSWIYVGLNHKDKGS